MPILVTALAATYGALTGLLLPRAVYQLAVPAGQPWRTTCPHDHNLPRLVGTSRCTPCRRAATDPNEPARLGPHPALTATVTALLCAVLTHIIGPHPELAAVVLTAPVAVVLGLVDLKVHRLPDILTLPLAATTALLLGAAALVPGAQGSWTRALLASVALAGAYFVLFLISPNSIGFGDVKLALTGGLLLGWNSWQAVLLGAFLGQLLVALHGLVVVMARGGGRKTTIPLGPSLLAGVYAALLMA